MKILGRSAKPTAPARYEGEEVSSSSCQRSQRSYSVNKSDGQSGRVSARGKETVPRGPKAGQKKNTVSEKQFRRDGSGEDTASATLCETSGFQASFPIRA